MLAFMLITTSWWVGLVGRSSKATWLLFGGIVVFLLPTIGYAVFEVRDRLRAYRDQPRARVHRMPRSP